MAQGMHFWLNIIKLFNRLKRLRNNWIFDWVHRILLLNEFLLRRMTIVYICWIISYFCFKSICAFFASCFFLWAKICLISEALILRFKSALFSLVWREGALRLEPLLLDVGEPGIEVLVLLPPLDGRLFGIDSAFVTCDRERLWGVELRDDETPFSYSIKALFKSLVCGQNIKMFFIL